MTRFKIQMIYENNYMKSEVHIFDSFNDGLLECNRIARKESEEKDFLYLVVFECTDLSMNNARLNKIAKFYNINK